MIIILVKDDWFDHSRTRQTLSSQSDVMCVFVCAYRAVYRHTLDINSTLNMKSKQNDINMHTNKPATHRWVSPLSLWFRMYGWRQRSLLVEEYIATVPLYSNDTWAENGFPTLYSPKTAQDCSTSCSLDIQRCIDKVDYIIGTTADFSSEINTGGSRMEWISQNTSRSWFHTKINKKYFS